MKKIIAILGTFIGLILCIISFVSFFDDTDSCLDSGICKAGLILNIDGEEIMVNRNTCIEHNGQWREKYNDCHFKR